MPAEKQIVNAAVVCHKGCVRNNNEDNFLFNGDRMKLQEMDAGAVICQRFEDACQLYAVVDGMGGGDLGERASAIAAGMLVGVLEEITAREPEQCMHQAVMRINRAIQEDCRMQGAEYEGTTLAALTIKNGMAYICNVGDSRVYRLRSGSLEQMTEDHSLVWDAFRNGEMSREQARKSAMNNMITKYLGMEDDEIPASFEAQRHDLLQEGDRFMICSDGVSDLLSHEIIAKLMMQNKDPQKCATVLVQSALEEGGKDNATCIVVDVGVSSQKGNITAQQQSGSEDIHTTTVPL